MQHMLLKFLNGEIHQIPSTRGKSLLLFNDGSSVKGSDIFYFWQYVDKYQNEYLATSVLDAINNGVTTFIAGRTCRKGHFPIRNLNDKCFECANHILPPLDGRSSPMSIMMRNAPNMVVDMESALLLGFTVYRTGDPCRHGHVGYRYTRNKTCVECHRLTKYHKF